MSTQVSIAILVGAAATIDDLARRHIANWIAAAALAGGFGWQIGQSGWHGAWNALGGSAAGFAAFLVFYLLGGMGGGDIKLMAGFGALLGPGRILEAALWTAGVGGILALCAISLRWVRGRVPGKFRRPEVAKADGTADADRAAERKESIPYAPAITLGVWLALVPKG